MRVLDDARILFVVAFIVLWLASLAGGWLGRGAIRIHGENRDDFRTVLGATLTLLGLIIGFSFSMAIGRYDQRKSYEEAEAGAIGTAYLRADLLPQENKERLRSLLREYTNLRIQYYEVREHKDLHSIYADTGKLQKEMWDTVSGPAVATPNTVTALALAGVSDLVTAQGNAQASWLNRIPPTAWCLMFAIAVFCNGLLGFGSKHFEVRLYMVLPLVVATSFFLIADIDSPRIGIIRVHPQDLEMVAGTLK